MFSITPVLLHECDVEGVITYAVSIVGLFDLYSCVEIPFCVCWSSFFKSFVWISSRCVQHLFLSSLFAVAVYMYADMKLIGIAYPEVIDISLSEQDCTSHIYPANSLLIIMATPASVCFFPYVFVVASCGESGIVVPDFP